MPNKMERFTQRARMVLSLAQDEATKLDHAEIDTDHMLLGGLRVDGGVSQRVLQDLGLELDPLREMAKKYNKSTRTADETIDLGDDVKKLLEHAVDEARAMGHQYLGTEHLLLGITRLSESRAKDLLRRNDISVDDVRRQTMQVLQEGMLQAEEETSTDDVPTPEPASVLLDWDKPTEYTFYGNQSMPTTKYVGQLIMLAERFRAKYQHRAILPAHLFIGMMHSEGLGRLVIDHFGVDDATSETILADMLAEYVITEGDNDDYANRLSPLSERVLQSAINIQYQYNQQLTNSAHVLQALMFSPTPAIKRILAQHKLTGGVILKRLDMVLSMERL